MKRKSNSGYIIKKSLQYMCSMLSIYTALYIFFAGFRYNEQTSDYINLIIINLLFFMSSVFLINIITLYDKKGVILIKLFYDFFLYFYLTKTEWNTDLNIVDNFITLVFCIQLILMLLLVLHFMKPSIFCLENIRCFFDLLLVVNTICIPVISIYAVYWETIRDMKYYTWLAIFLFFSISSIVLILYIALKNSTWKPRKMMKEYPGYKHFFIIMNGLSVNYKYGGNIYLIFYRILHRSIVDLQNGTCLHFLTYSKYLKLQDSIIVLRDKYTFNIILERFYDKFRPILLSNKNLSYIEEQSKYTNETHQIHVVAFNELSIESLNEEASNQEITPNIHYGNVWYIKEKLMQLVNDKVNSLTDGRDIARKINEIKENFTLCAETSWIYDYLCEVKSYNLIELFYSIQKFIEFFIHYLSVLCIAYYYHAGRSDYDEIKKLFEGASLGGIENIAYQYMKEDKTSLFYSIWKRELDSEIASILKRISKAIHIDSNFKSTPLLEHVNDTIIAFRNRTTGHGILTYQVAEELIMDILVLLNQYLKIYRESNISILCENNHIMCVTDRGKYSLDNFLYFLGDDLYILNAFIDKAEEYINYSTGEINYIGDLHIQLDE